MPVIQGAEAELCANHLAAYRQEEKRYAASMLIPRKPMSFSEGIPIRVWEGLTVPQKHGLLKSDLIDRLLGDRNWDVMDDGVFVPRRRRWAESERVRKIRILAERGATEGERAAAREALRRMGAD